MLATPRHPEEGSWKKKKNFSIITRKELTGISDSRQIRPATRQCSHGNCIHFGAQLCPQGHLSISSIVAIRDLKLLLHAVRRMQRNRLTVRSWRSKRYPADWSRHEILVSGFGYELMTSAQCIWKGSVPSCTGFDSWKTIRQLQSTEVLCVLRTLPVLYG